MKDHVTNKDLSTKLKEAGIEWAPRFGKKVWYKDRLMIVLRYQEMNVVGETLLKIVEDGTKETRFMPTFHEVKEKDIIPSFNFSELLAMIEDDWQMNYSLFHHEYGFSDYPKGDTEITHGMYYGDTPLEVVANVLLRRQKGKQ